ncbi:peptide deformylase [Erysipelothrix inopinata]|uniref:Peptide deformylase n=1 Tax=Erysipelothrix inopinata TaxID=225084 RepID=A0A7G9RY49_9FIRM|nr:peptide deformylase [Erysipelothrix inopinata]QNN60524.1 peptide deformylase [Erysipelothrix inopinata]
MNRITMDNIVQDPNPVLRQKAEWVSFPLQSDDIEAIEAMIQYVNDSRDDELAEKYNLQPANGIAAPQIGISKQMTVVVVEVPTKDGGVTEVSYALINPKIVSHAVKQAALSYGEGCLSISEEHPGLVRRAQRITIEAYDYITKKDVRIVAKDMLAIVLQHEIDHLNGVLFYDHIDQNNLWVAEEGLKIIE